MDDKVFELLTIMHNDIKDLKTGVGKLEKGQSKLEEGQNRLEQRVTKIEMLLENDINKKLDFTLEGYKQVYEKLQEHDQRFDAIESKLEKHDVEIRVIKGGK